MRKKANFFPSKLYTACDIIEFLSRILISKIQFKKYSLSSLFMNSVFANLSTQSLLLLLLLLLSRLSRVQLCHPIDGSPPGFPVPGILQARTMGWVAISFSNAWKWKVKVKLLSRVRLFVTPWTAAYEAPLSMGFPRQEYWSGLPLPSPKVCLQSNQCLWGFPGLCGHAHVQSGKKCELPDRYVLSCG